MHKLTRHGWELPERDVTPEALMLGRRAALAGAATGLLLPSIAQAQGAPRNPAYTVDR